jgi:hypothetical protein
LRSIRNAVEWSFSARIIKSVDCGSRIADWAIRNLKSAIRNLATLLPIRLFPLTCSLGLLAVGSTQAADQQQSAESKLPPVRCKITPTTDAVRWQLTSGAADAAGTPNAKRQTPNADNNCGPRIPDYGTDNPKPEIRDPKFSAQPIMSIAVAQALDQLQPIDPKLLPVRCKIAPTMDTVRWQFTSGTPTTPTCPTTVSDEACSGVSNESWMWRSRKPPEFRTTEQSQRTPRTEQNKPTQNPELQISYSGGRLPILNANFSYAKGQTIQSTTVDDSGSPNAKPQPVRRSLGDVGTPNVERTTPTRQQSIEPKLATVRSKFAPPKDPIRWSITPRTVSAPGAPTTLLTPITLIRSVSEPKPVQKVDPQTPDPGIQPPTPNADSSDAERQPVRNSLGDVGTFLDNGGTPNAERQTPNVDLSDKALATSERGPSTDTWFQIPTESQEPIDIQAAVVSTSANENNKVGPQPLAQVLADLARRAQRNFVDPGIPGYETIAYSFTDSDLDPWEAFTRIAQTRGYRIVYRDDIVTLVRGQEDPLSSANPQTVKAEIWVWLEQTSKPGADRSGLFIQAAGANVAPNIKPQTVRSLTPGSNAQISLFDVHSERGDSTLRLTVNPVALPNGLIKADLGIENAAPSSDGHKGVTIRRTINRTVELTPTKQVIQVDGILVPKNSPVADKQSWIQRWFRKKTPEPETATARMVVKLTVDPVPGSDTPIRTGNPGLKSDSGKTSIALAPSQHHPTPEFIVIQNLKH